MVSTSAYSKRWTMGNILAAMRQEPLPHRWVIAAAGADMLASGSSVQLWSVLHYEQLRMAYGWTMSAETRVYGPSQIIAVMGGVIVGDVWLRRSRPRRVVLVASVLHLTGVALASFMHLGRWELFLSWS